jgi:TatD DNase family protein
MIAGIIDTHAHMMHPDFSRDLESVLERARAAGVEAIVAVGYDLDSSRAAVELAAKYEFVYASVGVHPHDARLADDAAFQSLARLAAEPKVVAIGETGLDFYRNLSPRDAQVRSFRRHTELARERDLPLIVHDREAHADVLGMLKSSGLNKVILHCFSGDADMARQACELGFYIGIAGPVTFPSSRKLQEVLRSVPAEKVLVETDCPWLAPAPHRGKRNEPAYLPLIVTGVAAAWDLSADGAGNILTRNAMSAFPGIPSGR